MCYVMTNLTDIDHMKIDPNIIAIRRDVPFVRNVGEAILIIDTRDTQTGFVRLLKEHSNNVSFFSIDRRNLHGPAYTFTFADLDTIEQLNETAKTEPSRKGLDKLTQDEVVAIVCPFWPSEAQDWITRTTLSGWPEKGIKDHIVRGGCHFVAKSHHTEPDDSTQWRYSFSQAEVVLINSWNGVQKYIYHILRVIKGRITKTCRTDEKSVFNNYLIKTLILWASELNPAKFWAEENVEASVKVLLCQIIECLIERECPHYFISCLNILDFAVGSDINSEVSLLEQLMCKGVSRIMADFPKFDGGISMHVKASKQLIKHFSAHTMTDIYINPLHPTFIGHNSNGEFSNGTSICSELGNLFKAIMSHKRLQSLNSHERSRANITATIELFRRCLEEDIESHSEGLIDLQESFHVNVASIVNSCVSKDSSGSGISTRSQDGSMI